MANAISMQDFAMSAARRRALLVSDEFAAAFSHFLRCFEVVFGDVDWPTTLDNLQNDAEFLIAPHGTFLEPCVGDEDNNWGNRGSLLDAYRRLKHVMACESFKPVLLYPCGAVTKVPPAASDSEGL